jgi:hypothetical protein
VITRPAAASVLRLLTSAFPRDRLDDDGVETYLARMTSPPFTDTDTLLQVAEACVDELDRLPTLHQLLTAYQAASRANVANARLRDQRQLETAGQGRPRLDERYGREMVDVLRTALGEALPDLSPGESRGHVHKPGVPAVEICPVCSRSDETLTRFQARVPELLIARHLVAGAQPVQTYRCSRTGATCQDTGFVEVDDDPESFTVKPCPSCSPDAAEAWSNGTYGLRRGVTR